MRFEISFDLDFCTDARITWSIMNHITGKVRTFQSNCYRTTTSYKNAYPGKVTFNFSAEIENSESVDTDNSFIQFGEIGNKGGFVGNQILFTKTLSELGIRDR